ncbi:hypothetical protein P7C73_g1849, partial [Tremellales sp. Uapishka_1]
MHVPRRGQSSNSPTSPHLSLRKRRVLGQALALLGLVALGGTYILAPKGIHINWGDTSFFPASRVPLTPAPSSLIPGVVVGTQGVYLYSDPPSAGQSTAHPSPEPLSSWGRDLSSSDLLDGLSPWPPNPAFQEDEPALSTLGHFADDIYNLGPLDLESYNASLSTFISLAFPEDLQEGLQRGLSRYLAGGQTEDWDVAKNIWQTDKTEERYGESQEVVSWKDGRGTSEGWKWDLLSDREANKWVKQMLKESRMRMLWDNLPSGILRADTLRYLLLLLQGGIYSDTDTVLLKAPSKWGGEYPRLYKGGEGWLSDKEKERIQAGEAMDAVIGRPSVIVGIEADVGTREDWFDWWPRPMQIVQWTMASAPSHPIALQALLRILQSTASAIDWSHENSELVDSLQGADLPDKPLTVMSEPKEGGPVGVMAWTGPGVWTDAVLSYIRVKYGVMWTDLRGIQEPLRIGDVVILPVTGFSPGVGNFGSQVPMHRQAMVEHKFRGSWKDQPKR